MQWYLKNNNIQRISPNKDATKLILCAKKMKISWLKLIITATNGEKQANCFNNRRLTHLCLWFMVDKQRNIAYCFAIKKATRNEMFFSTCLYINECFINFKCTL